MKYYIVALLDKNSYDEILPLQRKYSKKFKANRNSPTPFIAIDVVDTSNIDKIISIMDKIIAPYKKFKIEYSDIVDVYPSLKTINMHVENRGYIKKITTTLTDRLVINKIGRASCRERV